MAARHRSCAESGRRGRQDAGIQAFLLTNLKPASPPRDPQTYRIRLPLDVLSKQLSSGDIGNFPFEAGEKEWDGKTLFIKGAQVRHAHQACSVPPTDGVRGRVQSKYINRKSLEPARALFPNNRLETLDAGHWGTSIRAFFLADGSLNAVSDAVHAEKPNEFIELVADFVDEK